MVYFERIPMDKAIKPGMNLDVTVDAEPEISGNYKSIVNDVYPETSVVKIGMPSIKGVFIPIPRGTRMHIKAFERQNLYEFDVLVLDKGRDEEGFYVLFVKTPPYVRRVQRRNFVRLRCALKGKYKRSTAEFWHSFTTRDISAGGMSFLTEEHLLDSEVLLVNLEFEEGLELKEQLTQIIRRLKMDRTDRNLVYAAKFLDIEPELQDKIIKHIFKVQIKLRKEGKM